MVPDAANGRRAPHYQLPVPQERTRSLGQTYFAEDITQDHHSSVRQLVGLQ
jgi:hypothetical protein